MERCRARCRSQRPWLRLVLSVERRMMTETSKKDVRAEFRPMVTAYRKRKRIGLWLILPMQLAAGRCWVLLAAPYSFIGGACFLALVFASAFFLPTLLCPSCRKDVHAAVDLFCPECGSASIKKDRPGKSVPKCTTCGRELWLSKGRRGVPLYSICYCTHCGAYLDEVGL